MYMNQAIQQHDGASRHMVGDGAKAIEHARASAALDAIAKRGQP